MSLHCTRSFLVTVVRLWICLNQNNGFESGCHCSILFSICQRLSCHCLVFVRIVGLNRFITVDCSEPWILHIRDGIKWTEYFNVAALLSFYFLVAIEVRRRSTSVWLSLPYLSWVKLDPAAFDSTSAVQFFSCCVFCHWGAIWVPSPFIHMIHHALGIRILKFKLINR